MCSRAAVARAGLKTEVVINQPAFQWVTHGKRVSLWMQILKSLLRNPNSCVVSGRLVGRAVELQLRAPLASAFLFSFYFSALTFACLSLSLPLGCVLASITAVKSGVTAPWKRQNWLQRSQWSMIRARFCWRMLSAPGLIQPWV